MTLAQAKAILTPLGVVIAKTEHNEYRVNFRGGKEGTASYESDLESAVGTGKAMAAEGAPGALGAVADEVDPKAYAPPTAQELLEAFKENSRKALHPLTAADAEKLADKMARAYNNDQCDDAMALADKLLEAHGVEALQPEGAYVNSYYQNTIALYVNMGDTYTTTLIFDTENHEFLIGDWGGFLEAWEAEQAEDAEDDDDDDDDDDDEPDNGMDVPGGSAAPEETTDAGEEKIQFKTGIKGMRPIGQEYCNEPEKFWKNSYVVGFDNHVNIGYIVNSDNEQDAVDDAADYAEEQGHEGHFLSDEDAEEHEKSGTALNVGNNGRPINGDELWIEQVPNADVPPITRRRKRA